MFVKKRKREPISISKEDVKRAFKSAEEFQKQIDAGKTPKDIFYELLNSISRQYG